MLVFNKIRWRMMLVLMIPAVVGFGPCTTGPRFLQVIPGGVVNGEIVAEKINDWSFIAGAGLCALETRPNYPHSVTVFCFTDNKKLFVGCMGCAEKTWSAYVANDDRARLWARDMVYPVTMRRISDRESMQEIWDIRNTGREPRPMPETYWLYELTSR